MENQIYSVRCYEFQNIFVLLNISTKSGLIDEKTYIKCILLQFHVLHDNYSAEFDPSSSSSSESGNDEQLTPFQNKDQDLAQSQDLSQTQDLAQSQDISQTLDQNQDSTGNTSGIFFVQKH